MQIFDTNNARINLRYVQILNIIDNFKVLNYYINVNKRDFKLITYFEFSSKLILCMFKLLSLV